jgi:hypothetical protein
VRGWYAGPTSRFWRKRQRRQRRIVRAVAEEDPRLRAGTRTWLVQQGGARPGALLGDRCQEPLVLDRGRSSRPSPPQGGPRRPASPGRGRGADRDETRSAPSREGPAQTSYSQETAGPCRGAWGNLRSCCSRSHAFRADSPDKVGVGDQPFRGRDGGCGRDDPSAAPGGRPRHTGTGCPRHTGTGRPRHTGTGRPRHTGAGRSRCRRSCARGAAGPGVGSSFGHIPFA